MSPPAALCGHQTIKIWTLAALRGNFIRHLIQRCEALSFRFRSGGPFGQNRGVLTAVWHGPFWVDVLGMKQTDFKESSICIPMIIDELSHGVHDLFVGTRDPRKLGAVFVIFKVRHDQKHENTQPGDKQ